MKRKIGFFLTAVVTWMVMASAGFAAVSVPGDWIGMNDPSIMGWATGWKDYNVGTHVDAGWQTPDKALGKAVGSSYDIVSLGRGGSITLTFDTPIANGGGADFAIFENSFSDTFLELAYVEVSSNGTDFVRFDNWSATPSPVSAYGNVDPNAVYQLAGKHKQGRGTLFDLDMLQYNQSGDSSILDLENIWFIRLVDIIGDGTYQDSWGNVIYDPYPTTGSAGFDLDAVAVLNQGAAPPVPTPLPGGILLLGSGILGLAGLRRKHS